MYRFVSKIILCFVLVVGSTTACSLLPSKQSSVQTSSNPELERAYEAHIPDILAPYWQSQATAGVKQQLLDVRAPAKYLDLHLKLVLAFERIEQGQTQAAQEDIEEGVTQLQELVQRYPWIKR